MIGFVVYVHHTHVKVSWHDNKAAWTQAAPFVSTTVHLTFPFKIGAMMHHIMEHTAHHVDMSIPLYRLKQAQAKLEEMYKEYHEKNAALSDTKGKTESMNQRQFMSQLLNLRERVQGDLQRSDSHLANLGAHMVLAETERLKMQTLTENDRLAVEKFVEKREQSRMDEMGVMQFNRAQTP